jgi:hypothetical protein
MSSRLQLRFLIAILVFVGLGFALYKVLILGYPMVPREQVKVWTIEARVAFEADGGPVRLDLAVPYHQQHLVLVEEDGASPGYGFTPPTPVTDGRVYRKVTWARAKAEGRQQIYYRTVVLEGNIPLKLEKPTTPPEPDLAFREEPLRTAMDGLIEMARERSADGPTFMGQVSQMLTTESPSQNAKVLLRGRTTTLDQTRLFQNILLRAGYNAHLIRGLHLEDSQRRQSLVSALAIMQGADTFAFRLGETRPGLPQPFLIWQRGGPALVELEGGSGASVHFSVLRDKRPKLDMVEKTTEARGNRIADFSIYSLPIDQQNSFRTLLMVPIGALIVVLMRNLVGLKTSGTFMPILLAMAFIQTQLITGLVIFSLVVTIGLAVRSYLSRLDLLLVPRISSVVVVVIGIMVGASIIGHHMDLAFARSVTLFPTIILAWTVERLSVSWEEEGPRDVLIQTAGSLTIAIIAYFAMGNPMLKYIVFTFPELILVVLAIILMMGQYSGYRLSELHRFQPLTEGKGAA